MSLINIRLWPCALLNIGYYHWQLGKWQHERRDVTFWYVERVFSQVNLMKTKVRNSLNTEILNGMLHAKRTFENASAHNFE